MKIDDIKDPALRELFAEVKHASSTIMNDAGDALEESSNDEELVTNWQSQLEGLRMEVEHYWSELEGMKSGEKPDDSDSPTVPMGTICFKHPAQACYRKSITGDHREIPACRNGVECDGTGIKIPPAPPETPQNPPKSLAGAIRDYLKLRGIWEKIGDRFALNDEVSKQVRRDTLRFRIEERHRVGV